MGEIGLFFRSKWLWNGVLERIRRFETGIDLLFRPISSNGASFGGIGLLFRSKWFWNGVIRANGWIEAGIDLKLKRSGKIVLENRSVRLYRGILALKCTIKVSGYKRDCKE